MNTLIKSLVPFTDDYLPPSIIDREIERVELKRFLLPIAESQMQLYNLLITGGVGVGKTLLTRFVVRDLPSNSYYMRMTEGDNTTTKIIFKLISILGVPISAYLPSNIALMKLTEYLDEKGKKNKTATLLVLDDLDKVPIDAIRLILHEIPRSTNWCNFLFISRIPSVLENLPTDTKSTLKCRELPLIPYSKEMIFKIVKQRAEMALTNPDTIDSEVLEKISNHASLSGSAREAIDLLKTACIIAENFGDTQVTKTYFDAAIEEIERKSIDETITTLPLYHKLLIECCKKYPQTYEQVYRVWIKKLKEKGLNTLSIYRFRDFVSDLKKLDLIRPDIKGHGRGKGFSYYLTLSPHIPER